MEIIAGIVLGFLAWFIVRYLIAGLYTIDQNERAVITSFGRAQRLGNATTLDDPISETLVKDELEALLADVEPDSHASDLVGAVRVVPMPTAE